MSDAPADPWQSYYLVNLYIKGTDVRAKGRFGKNATARYRGQGKYPDAK